MEATSQHILTPEAVVAEIRTWLGTPYHHQASVRGVGADCGGVQRGSADALGIVWPGILDPFATVFLNADWYHHTRREWFLEFLQQIPALVQVPKDDLRLADTLLFRWPGKPHAHTGIVSAMEPSLKMIHSDYKRGVMEEPLTPTWLRLLGAAFRLRVFAEVPRGEL